MEGAMARLYVQFGGAKLPLSRSYVRCAGRLEGYTLGTDRRDSFLQHLNAVHQPGEFLGCDFECWRIARIDISAVKTRKCALCKLGVRSGHMPINCGAIRSACERRNRSLWDLGLYAERRTRPSGRGKPPFSSNFAVIGSA
jgi:hypothetical protein